MWVPIDTFNSNVFQIPGFKLEEFKTCICTFFLSDQAFVHSFFQIKNLKTIKAKEIEIHNYSFFTPNNMYKSQ